MVKRDGITIVNVQDFDFDAQGRMVMTVSNGDSYAISKPVVDGDFIVIDRIVGGRQNGMGTGPGEFQGPVGITVDPRNQNHIVCDTGNNRVQIFDSQGNYVRQFLTTGTAPRVSLVDYWGNILVATNNGLEIYNEQGSLPVYGSVQGFVIDKESRLPLEYAIVYITSTFQLPTQGVYTNKDGYFKLSTVPAGTHNIIALKDAYFDSSVMVEVSAGKTSESTIYLTRIPVSSPGTGNVTGTIMSALRAIPIPGLTIGIKGTGVSDLSNNNGEFLLIGVPTGPQKLEISTNGVIIWEKNIQVPDGQTLDTGFIQLQR
jgi:DNA-binding beta-propeller fold protein YncE